MNITLVANMSMCINIALNIVRIHVIGSHADRSIGRYELTKMAFIDDPDGYEIELLERVDSTPIGS